MRMTTIGRRIQSVRRTLGETQAQFAVRFGVDQSTISKWENDRQAPEPAHLDIIGSLIEDGDTIDVPTRGESMFHMVPLVGRVGLQAMVFPVDTDSAEANIVRYLRAPRGFGAVEAIEVSGDSMYPVYRNGDIVYIERRSAAFPLNPGREYVVKLTDGRTLLKMVEISKDGHYTLFAYNAPPEHNAEIIDAHAVRYIRRA